MSGHFKSAYVRGPLKTDLSHAPEHVKAAFDRPLEWRTGEVPCQITTQTARAGTNPTARLFASTVVAPNRPEMVAMRVLDSRGMDAIAQVDIDVADLPALLQHLITIYKSKGGRLRPILDAYEGKTE